MGTQRLTGADCFFFNQKTAYEMTYGDGSSDVCSSDLIASEPEVAPATFDAGGGVIAETILVRSEERRVGKEGRSRGSPYHYKKKNRTRLKRNNRHDSAHLSRATPVRSTCG